MRLDRILLFLRKKVKMPSKREVANKNSDTFIKYLRKKGVTIGNGCEFFKPETQFIDPSNPELIIIGNKVKISLSVSILTHGFDYSVLRELHPGECFGSAGLVVIGDNVFIGMNSTILKDAVIGNNCVIGAGSIVRGRIPDNTVAAGNPAKVIMTVDELYQKHRVREIEEAEKMAHILYKRRGIAPELSDFTEYFYLFSSVEEAETAGIDVIRQATPEYYEEFKKNNIKKYPSFREFLKYCNIPINRS